MDVNGQLHAPAALLPGKKAQIPIAEEVGWVPVPVWTRWQKEKYPIIAPAGNWAPVVQPVT